MVSYKKDWVEIFFFALLVLGFILSAVSRSAVISYMIIFVVGMMAGRIMYERKQSMKFPYYLIIFGFLVGYVIGAFYGNRNIIIILFILGSILSYYLHDKGVIRSIQF